ncbi:MAG: membrane protease YdiL (CAAX protease family) [Cellvibrionaceae bacterium]|jgi:membrane protease YdiL (CAAX protease family)
MKHLKSNTILFLLGFIGVLSVIPLLPRLLEAQPQPIPVSLATLQLLSVIQSAVLLILMVIIGSFFARKVNLKAPVISAVGNSESMAQALRPQIMPAIWGGTLGGVLLILFFNGMSGYLPAQFLSAGEQLSLPWYTRLLYGGITEEILVRWGIMSLFVWVLYRLTQPKETPVKSYNYLFGIIISAILFGLGHLPAASLLTSELTTLLIVYIILGNAIFGFIAGYLFWKKGLESAILAHIITHLILIAGAALGLS